MTSSTTPVVCLTLAKWETVSGQFGGYLTEDQAAELRFLANRLQRGSHFARHNLKATSKNSSRQVAANLTR